MKKHFAIFLSIALSFSSVISVFGSPVNTNLPIQNINIDKTKSFSQNGITYTITQDAKETLKGYVTLSTANGFTDKNLNIPKKVNYQGREYTVDSIAPYAFYQNNNIEKVVIPNTIKTIGEFAFLSCQNLKDITVIPGANAYASINGVLYNVEKDTLIAYPMAKPDKQFTLPVGVEKIETASFYNNRFLEKLITNSSLKEIGAYSFSKTQKLKDISTPIMLETIGDYAFANSSIESIPLPTTLDFIGEAVFYESNLKTINIPHKIKSLPEYTFYNCKNLKSVYFVDGNTSIDRFAFKNSGLETVSLSSTMNSIDYEAFANCTNLKEIKFNRSLSSIGERAFANCTSLPSLTITGDLKTIGKDAFVDCNNISTVSVDGSTYFETENNILYTNSKEELVFIPTKTDIYEIEIPAEVKTIREEVFNNIKTLENIFVHPDNEKFSSENGVLYDKDKKKLLKVPPKKDLINFNILDTVEELGNNAFTNCVNISGFITIPYKLTKIGTNSFDNMPTLDGFNVDSNNEYFIADNNILYNKDKSTLIKYPARKTANSFTMLNETKTVGKKAFEGANISTVTLGVNVENVEEQAFLNAPIRNIVVKEGVKNIKEEAFKGSKIENIVLPSTLQVLGDSTFSYCNNLKSVQFNALQINSFGYNMFIGSDDLEKIIVPVNSYNNYKNYLIESGVSNWQNILQEYKPPVQ